MKEQFETIIIGAGQAGLAMGYHLLQKNQDFVIFEKAAQIVPAWRERWDSFSLVLPNWTLQMPDFPYQGDDPNGFLSRDQVVDYFERFADKSDFEIRFNSPVTSIKRNPGGGNFMVKTTDKTYEAENVVIATSTFQKPKIPHFSENISDQFRQLHTSHYRNPDELPQGAVLVVGSGQSGCQIAEELYQSGRKVYLCVGRANRIPRFYRGKDLVWWLDKVGFFDQTVDSLESPKIRFDANPFLSGKGGGRSLDLHKFAQDGVQLLGRLQDAQGTKLQIAPDLIENLTNIDNFVKDVLQKIDGFIEASSIEAEPRPKQTLPKDGYESQIIRELDLEEEGINTILWATGYDFDFSYIDFPVMDEFGYPIQTRGVSEIPGLYFLGLHWLYKRRSGLPWGVGEDAAYIAEQIIHTKSQILAGQV